MKILTLSVLMSCAAAWVTHGQSLALHVGPNGNDAWTGTPSEPNAAGTDGPLASLEGARDRIRKLRGAGSIPGAGVVVNLRGGMYELGRRLELGKQDSGTAAGPIVYRAQPGETARLLGGRIVRGFSPVTDPGLLEMLEPSARGKVMAADLRAQGIVDFGSVGGGGMEVFFRDRPMTVSRWPNKGFTRIVSMVGAAEKRDRHMTHKVGKWTYDGDRPARWVGEKDVWVHGYWFHDWSEQRHRVKEIDTDQRTIEVAPPYHGYGYRKGKWYYAFNLFSEIDSPGEWYLDRETGVLYFWPPEPVRDGDVLVSVLPSLAALVDASHVHIEHLLFEGCRGTAMSIRGGTGNVVAGCTFRNAGGAAVSVSNGTRHRVVGCEVYETGAGGISLTGGDRKTLTPAGHVAENNHIHHYARIKRVYQPGLRLSGVGSAARHNLIHSAPHMAMGFGGNDHTIELNEIHSVCYESNDAGAIYTGRNWTMRGNIIRHNYLHHINGFEGRGCVGVYLDDSFSSADIVGNVFYKVTRAAMIGGGRDSRIVNNVFVDCVPAVHVDARGVGWANRYIVPGGGWNMQEKLAAVPYKEAPWTKYPNLANILDDDPYLPKHNTVAHNISVRGKWDGIRAKARPHVTIRDNLIDGDVDFVDEAAGNFQLPPGSVAFDAGFKRIPVEKIGLYNSVDRASWPVAHSVRPMATPPPKPQVKRDPAPVYHVARTTAAPTIDGTLNAAEWLGLDSKRAMVVEQGIQGQKIAPRTLVWALRDDTALYVGIRNLVDTTYPLKTKAEWGLNDAVEVALRNPAVKGAPVIVLRGYPEGQFESSTEAGTPFEVAQDAKAGSRYAARIASPAEWTAEWCIPFAAVGIEPETAGAVPFNLSVRKTAALQWMMWHGTGGYTWQVDAAGTLKLGK